jgi:hypothetical protein
MNYELNELTLTLPETIQDRSVNVLLFGTKQPPEFNLVISRDFLPKGEQFQYIVKKQIDLIASAQENFKQTAPERSRTLPTKDGGKVDAKETAISYKHKGATIFQRHLYVPLGGPKILIFAGTAMNTWNAKDEQTWESIIKSLVLKIDA